MIGDDIAEGIGELRANAVSLMFDTCTITRKTGTVWDPDLDKNVPTFSTIYTGPCRIKPDRAPREVQSGQVAVMQHRYVLRMPWDASPAALRGDVVTITASADAWVIGRPLVVRDIDYASVAIERRLALEDAS